MRNFLFFTLATLFSFTGFAQKSNDKLIRDYFKKNTTTFDLQKSSAKDFQISRVVEDKQDGLTHFYVNQTLNGLAVVNGTAVFIQKG